MPFEWVHLSNVLHSAAPLPQMGEVVHCLPMKREPFRSDLIS